MKIEFTRAPSEGDILSIYTGLVAFNAPHFPSLSEQNIAFFVRDQQGAVIGGIAAKLLYTSIFIDYLWLPESVRGLGLGKKLMQSVELEALGLGVMNIYLHTYSFQAPKFYEKYGFNEVGRYVDYPKQGVDKIFFQKNISSH